MIVLDTHVWFWWVSVDPKLPSWMSALFRSKIDEGLGVSAISCWEVAKKVETGKMRLDRDIRDWIRLALSSPGIRLMPLSPEIAVESTRLPAPFHKDPADQIIVATSRLLDSPLATVDGRILDYPHVNCLKG